MSRSYVPSQDRDYGPGQDDYEYDAGIQQKLEEEEQQRRQEESTHHQGEQHGCANS